MVDRNGVIRNNRAWVDSGVKLARNVQTAVVDAGVAQRVVREWKTGGTQASPVVFVNFWIGGTPHLW